MAFGEKKDDKRTLEYKKFCEKFKDYPKRDRLNYSEAERKWSEYENIYNKLKEEGCEYPALNARDKWFIKEGAMTEDGAVIYVNLRKILAFSGKDDEVYIYDKKILPQVEEDFAQITRMFSKKKDISDLFSENPLKKVETIGKTEDD